MATKRYKNGKFSHYEDVIYHATGERDDTGRLTYRKQWVRGRTLKDLAKNKQAAIDERDGKPRDEQPEMLLRELVRLVMERHVKRLRPKSQEVWRGAMVKRIHRLFEIPIGHLTTEKIDEWMSELQSETEPKLVNGKWVDARVHGDRSINLARGCLVTTLNKGKKWGYVGDRNVAEHADRFREDTRNAYVYTPEQIGHIGVGMYRRHMDGVGKRGYNRSDVLEFRAHRDMCILLVLAFAGLRISEAFALRWMDLKSDGLLRVEHSFDWSAKDYLGPVKTGAARSVPLLPEAILAFERLREIMPHTEPTDFVLSSERTDVLLSKSRPGMSRPMNRDAWRSKNFIQGATIAGFPEARPHFMRHTFISLMRRHGFSSSEVAGFVGDTEAVIDRVYTHTYQDGLAERMAEVSSKLWS